MGAACQKVAGGLLAGGLALLPPASSPSSHIGAAGGFPAGIISEYGGTGAQRGGAAAAGSSFAGGAIGTSFGGGEDRLAAALTALDDSAALALQSTALSFAEPDAPSSAPSPSSRTLVVEDDPIRSTRGKPVFSDLAVPEPPSALLLVPLVALLWWGRRRAARSTSDRIGQSGRADPQPD